MLCLLMGLAALQVRCGSPEGPPLPYGSESTAAGDGDDEAAPGGLSSVGGGVGEGGLGGNPEGWGGQLNEPNPPLSCPKYAMAEARTRPAGTLAEASGLVASRLVPERLWTHNDSGDSARLFALDVQGELEAIIHLDIDYPTDWEDIASFRDEQGTPFLLIADTGDNALSRADVSFVVVPEPLDLDQEGKYPAQVMSLTYPDGPHNAEALFVDEISGRAYVLTKDSPAQLYSFSLTQPEAVLHNDGVIEAEWAKTLMPRGAAMRAEYPWIVLRGAEQTLVFVVKPGQSVVEALHGPSCPVMLADEVQGEAITLDGEGNLYSIGEAVSPLEFYALLRSDL